MDGDKTNELVWQEYWRLQVVDEVRKLEARIAELEEREDYCLNRIYELGEWIDELGASEKRLAHVCKEIQSHLGDALKILSWALSQRPRKERLDE